MSTKQIESCAARLPEPQRSQFLETQARATALVTEGLRLRRQAWERYREITGLPRGAKSNPITSSTTETEHP